MTKNTEPKNQYRKHNSCSKTHKNASKTREHLEIEHKSVKTRVIDEIYGETGATA